MSRDVTFFPRYKNARPVGRLQLRFVNKHRGRKRSTPSSGTMAGHEKGAKSRMRQQTPARARARLRRCDTFDARLSNKLSTLWHSRRNRTSMVYDRCREEAPDERTDMLDMVRDIRHKHATSSFTHFAPISVENLEIPLKGNRRYVSLFARHSCLH